jgi:hypothetical protein
MAYILGQFPPTALNKLLSPEQVEEAMRRHYKEPDYAASQKRLGVDVARFGDDRTILFPRQGLVAFRPIEMRGATGPEVAARAARSRDNWGWERCFVDDTGGFGSSVIDQMRLGQLPVSGINFSSKASDSRYFNLRSEMWLEMAEWVKRGGCLPNLPQLTKELTTPTYYFHQGKLRLEEKDQIKERLKFSPDMADALSLTFAVVDQPSATADPYAQYDRHKGKTLHEWDPLTSS